MKLIKQFYVPYKLVPLYAKKVQADIPVLNQPCGYDLEVGDWVMPYGKGINQDFIFTVYTNVKDRQNFDAQGELTFADPLDGLASNLNSQHWKKFHFQVGTASPRK